jgi:uncharacterized repeat protein (TIGR03803 family)
VFAVNTDGTGFTNLYSFTPTTPSCCDTDAISGDVYCGCYTNSDGANPYAGLILSGNTLYGTAVFGGSANHGTVFAVNTNGTGFTNLHSFTPGNGVTNSDGAYPRDGLVLSGNTLYGTAAGGGSSGEGTVFAVHTDGTGFTNLHSFTAAADPYYTNSDGRGPSAGLILSGSTLYGTAGSGGSGGNGTVFAVNTDGTSFTNLHTFAAPQCCSQTNSDGAYPRDGLVLLGNTLYGTASASGSSGEGTVFAVHTDGTGFTNLHSFTATPAPYYTNSDGAGPGGLILSGNSLYGTAGGGGSSRAGTVFSLSFRPQLTIVPSGTNVILSWPISYAGYYLQETANLSSPTNWNSVADTNVPVIINGQMRVTRPMLGPQWSYRLRKF